MDISSQEGKKIRKIFKILEYSEKEIVDHMEKLGDRLLMDVVAQALSQSSEGFSDEIKTRDDVAEFLLKNYSSEEIKNMTDMVFRDVVIEYFAGILRNISEDKQSQIEEILNSIE